MAFMKRKLKLEYLDFNEVTILLNSYGKSKICKILETRNRNFDGSCLSALDSSNISSEMPELSRLEQQALLKWIKEIEKSFEKGEIDLTPSEETKVPAVNTQIEAKSAKSVVYPMSDPITQNKPKTYPSTETTYQGKTYPSAETTYQGKTYPSTETTYQGKTYPSAETTYQAAQKTEKMALYPKQDQMIDDFVSINKPAKRLSQSAQSPQTAENHSPETMSKFSHILQESQAIHHKDIYTIYKYNCDERYVGSSTERCVTGDRLKRILVIGETGCGKSTLINAMANYAFGVEYANKLRFQIIDVEKVGKKSQSQTKAVTRYRIPDYKLGFELELCDTPGFGDTRGVEQDRKTKEEIEQFLTEVDCIHAICLVVRSSDTKLSDTMQYVINKMLGLFYEEPTALENMYVLITFADGNEAPVNSVLKKSEFPYKSERCFSFNNSALYEFNPSHDRTELVEMFWAIGNASLQTFFEHLKIITPYLTPIPIDPRLAPFGKQIAKKSNFIENSGQLVIFKYDCLYRSMSSNQSRETSLWDNKNYKRVLFIGETGGGKTTLLNAIANHIIGVQFEDIVRFKIIIEDKAKQSASQTQFITRYQLPTEATLGYTLELIDTPGFADTAGRDSEIMRQFADFYKEISEVHAVCIVVKASDCKLTDKAQYVLLKAQKLFGAHKNIHVLVTFADAGEPPVLHALQSSSTFAYDNSKVFVFNNCALYESDPKRYQVLKMFWEMGKTSINLFLDHISKTNPYKISIQEDIKPLQSKGQTSNFGNTSKSTYNTPSSYSQDQSRSGTTTTTNVSTHHTSQHGSQTVQSSREYTSSNPSSATQYPPMHTASSSSSSFANPSYQPPKQTQQQHSTGYAQDTQRNAPTQQQQYPTGYSQDTQRNAPTQQQQYPTGYSQDTQRNAPTQQHSTEYSQDTQRNVPTQQQYPTEYSQDTQRNAPTQQQQYPTGYSQDTQKNPQLYASHHDVTTKPTTTTTTTITTGKASSTHGYGTTTSKQPPNTGVSFNKQNTTEPSKKSYWKKS